MLDKIFRKACISLAQADYAFWGHVTLSLNKNNGLDLSSHWNA